MDSSKQTETERNENSAMEIDRISELPDSIQFKILNCLDLKEAARTAELSKQWRFLWTNVPFAFKNWSKDMEEVARFVATVHAALAPRRGSALDSLFFFFVFDERFTSDVDSWIDFAAKNEVKHLILCLERNYSDESVPQHNYTLPQILYSNSSLRWLELKGCSIASPETTLEWRCLKCLSLQHMELPQQRIGEIVSGCPNLECLYIGECYGFSRLEIGGRKLIGLGVKHEYSLEISAPYLHYLDIEVISSTARVRPVVRLQNLSSLETASVAVSELHWPGTSSVETIRYTTVELLRQLAHVKTLKLSESCAKAASFMATKGWQLPQLGIKELKMRSENHAHSIYGILAILESSPYLKNLVIQGFYEEEDEEEDEEEEEEEEKEEDEDEDEEEEEEEDEVDIIWGPTTKDDMNCNLLHLKTVEIQDFYGSESDIPGEPTLTLARVLLKRAPALEKMTILSNFSSVETDFIKKTVLSYPTSSTNVSVKVASSSSFASS